MVNGIHHFKIEIEKFTKKNLFTKYHSNHTTETRTSPSRNHEFNMYVCVEKCNIIGVFCNKNVR